LCFSPLIEVQNNTENWVISFLSFVTESASLSLFLSFSLFLYLSLSLILSISLFLSLFLLSRFLCIFYHGMRQPV